MDAEHVALQSVRQVRSEHRNGGAEQGEDQDPQQHGSLVISPDARDLVEQRLQRMGIRSDDLD